MIAESRRRHGKRISLQATPDVKARLPLCDQTATHPSRKACEGWGTHCEDCANGRWATRPVITSAGRLPPKHVIHSVGPVKGVWTERDAEMLASSYRNSILLAEKHGVR